METEDREITQEYLNAFINSIKTGGKVIYVEEESLLAVGDVTRGYLVLRLKDKVVDIPEDEGITNAS